MKQRIGPGAVVDFVTPDEVVKLIPRPEQKTRIREPGQVQLNASGNGIVSVYTVPPGYEFEARRIYIDIGTADPTSGSVALNVAGKCVIYQKSGERIEFGEPVYGSNVQVPGSQSWGDEQGPYLRNGETFEVVGVGLTANAYLTVTLEGILTRPASNRAA